MIDDKKTSSGSERVARHRVRERERTIQAALAISRIVLGRDPGDASRALADFLLKQSKLTNLPDEYQEIMSSASDQLRRRRR